MRKTMKDYLDNEHFDEIIDVREIDEYTRGHIKGATHIPLPMISSYKDDYHKKIAVYCHSGRRSGMACEVLKANGYTNVTNIGGITDGSMPLSND